MGLNKIRLGDYIIRSNQNNRDLEYGVELISGVTSQGVFAIPKGDPIDVNLKPYKIVNNGAFVYNPTRLDLGSIAYRTDGLCIVSHLYMVFYLTEEGKRIIDPTWLYIYFRRNEFLREVTFRNFGSQRPEFNFEDMSDIIIPLPDLPTQQKYVDIYNAMVANQQAYERGLEDLKVALDAQIDKIKHSAPRMRIGNILDEVDNRNSEGVVKNVQGINISKQFMPSVADINGVDLRKYKVVQKGQLAFSGMQTGRDECIRIALHDTEQPIIISPAYTVFEVKEETVIPEYVMIWFSRNESDRRGWFMSDSSIRSNLDLERFYEIQIPIPDKKLQEAVVTFYEVYITRKKINEQLKAQSKNICPILIRGSLEEGK
jgi:conserved domain protein